MLPEEKNNVAGYFGPINISPSNKQNSSMTLKNRFLTKIIKKNLKYVLLLLFKESKKMNS